MNGKKARTLRKLARYSCQTTDYTLEPSTRRAHVPPGGGPTYHTATILLARGPRKDYQNLKRDVKQ